MRILRSGALALLLLATAAGAASASQSPSLFQSGRYAALGANGSLSFVVQRSQITGLQVRMPLACQNTRTHRRSTSTLAFGARSAGRTTYSRIYLPADGSANVTFVADDNSRQPEIYLSLQLHGGIGHVSVHARSQAARETCSGALGFDVRAR
ncbi:MAG: hypothetical protein M3Q31_06495 [Actinomycetota bacterium]|nr:hypothetical protein [Actinomycetota bacterium]